MREQKQCIGLANNHRRYPVLHNHIAQRYSPYLHRYYERIRARRGTGKAIIALARKFLSIIYCTLKNNWIFEDFPNFVLAQAET